jgi:hypothetical protein
MILTSAQTAITGSMITAWMPAQIAEATALIPFQTVPKNAEIAFHAVTANAMIWLWK